MLIWTQTRSVI